MGATSGGAGVVLRGIRPSVLVGFAQKIFVMGMNVQIHAPAAVATRLLEGQGRKAGSAECVHKVTLAYCGVCQVVCEEEGHSGMGGIKGRCLQCVVAFGTELRNARKRK